MLTRFASAAVLILAGLASAAPYTQPKACKCSLKGAKPALPSGQTTLAVPSGENVEYVALGVGVQNFTCSAAGTYTSVGAVAELLDISCFYQTPAFDSIQDKAYAIFNASSKLTTQDVIKALGSGYPVLGQHYFIANPFTGTGVSPVFDSRAAAGKGNPDAYVVANKTGGITSPAGPQNADWLYLTGLQGGLAKHVFRLDTKAGQPPSSCTPGSAPLSVKYATKYWLYI